MSNAIHVISDCQTFCYDEETHLYSFVKKDLYFLNGKFIDHSEVNSSIIVNIDAKGGIVIPGFIDLQLNGGCGKSFSDPHLLNEDFEVIGKLIASHGCTSYYPTIISTTPEIYKQAIPNCGPKKKPCLPEILGCHLEGPFLNELKKGAHEENNLLKPIVNEDPELLKSNLNYIFGQDNLKFVKNMTIAPELENSNGYIKLLKKHNIKISCGHSNISLEELVSFIQNDNIQILTHFYNAMTLFNQRQPGIIGLLGAPKPILSQFFYSIIVDGIHVHPYLVNMAYRLHPDGFIMITDGNTFLGRDYGTYEHDTRKVSIVPYTFTNGNVSKKIVLADSPTVLVGSMVSMIECFNNFIEFTGCPLLDAVKCASLHPAKAMGIDNTKGLLEPGYDADFIIIHENKNKPNSYSIQSTYINGTCGYESNKVI